MLNSISQKRCVKSNVYFNNKMKSKYASMCIHMWKRYLISIFLVAFVVGSVFFNTAIRLTVDWLFYQEINLADVFITIVKTRLAVLATVFLVSFVFLATNVYIATIQRGLLKETSVLDIVPKFFRQNMKTFRAALMGMSALISLFFGIIFSAAWFDIAHAYYAQPFNVSDPIFNRDIGFYIFMLPIYQWTVGYMLFLTIVSIGVVIFLYVSSGSVELRPQKPHNALYFAHRAVRWHLGVLTTLLFVVITGLTYLSRFDIIHQSTNLIYGASYSDIYISLPANTALVIAWGICAIGALAFTWNINNTLIIVGVAMTIVVNITHAVIKPAVERFIVAPNELSVETPYIEYTIDGTRNAYSIANVNEQTLDGSTTITAEDIAANRLTIDNVRVWDRDPYLSALSQLQEIRTYYDFAHVDNGRYTIDGELRQTMLSARELNPMSLPNRTWINERLTFTHGFGLAGGPVNQVTPEGLPVLYVKDIPPQSTQDELAIARPEIYYGETTSSYVIANTPGEFAYPQGEENVFHPYEGVGGVALDSLWKKIIFAIQHGSLSILLNSDIKDESRIMSNRQIMQRAHVVAPFLTFDRDPYIVIADGRLYWIMDAYTQTRNYPYSQPVSLHGKELNYIRNSVKVVVDAYSGEMQFYIADTQDPIVQTTAKLFPTLFSSIETMPQSIKAHIRYPEDIFRIQTEMYRTYHMQSVQTFYNKEDQWDIPAIADQTVDPDNQSGSLAPRHLIMKLPESTQEEYVLMLPYTPRGKDNLAAWIAARNDGEHYGKIQVYRFPKDQLIFGPQQIISRINQDATISQQISLWDQRGSQVIQGPLLVIPIEQALLYVRPLYLKAETGKIPELKRVIVAYRNNIAMSETLEQALAIIFGNTNDEQEVLPPQQQQSFAEVPTDQLEQLVNALETYQKAVNAQQSGDWAQYGRHMDELGKILREAEAMN